VIWKRLEVLTVLSLLLGAAAVAQNQSGAAPGPEAAPNTPKPLPGLDDPAVSGAQVDDAYIIGPTDVLYINVFHDKDYTNLYVVSPDGMITVPLFGEMKASGLTRIQLGNQFAEALSQNFRDPQVSVSIYDVRSKTYTVAGGVKRPGPYKLTHPITVSEAINEAGGFQDTFSDRKNILIIRGAERLKFNFEDYLKGKNRDKDIELKNGDTIYVKN
jgi:polysaccharide export outer membrane protein